jgi:ribosomal protein S18 acetylase RimI-like enzyme
MRPSSDREDLVFRKDVVPGDVVIVREIVESSGFFHPYEIEVAVELVEERLQKGIDTGYHFLFAQQGEEVLGYSCFGPIACTVGSYDLYWIAVRNHCRGLGIGRDLLARTEREARARGGRRLYVETSSRPLYEPTRQFYLRYEYREEAILSDFYAPGDHKVIFVKVL